MPIANCFLKNKDLSPQELEKIGNEWAALIGVDIKDISINFVVDFIQIGQQYDALVYLYLPSLWADEDKRSIQLNLLKVLVKRLKTVSEKVFVITSIIATEHVVENGKLVSW